MANEIQEDLGKALAPEDEMFDIVEDEEVTDPLAEGAGLIVEEDPLSFTVEEDGIPENDLAGLTDASIGMADDLMGNVGDEVEIVENTMEDDDIVEVPEDNEELEIVDDQDVVNPIEPGALVASVLNTARKFAEYREDSQNSIRRAKAICDQIEEKIISGVMADAKSCKLNLAQLRLLDDIEAGIHETRAHLERHSGKKAVYAKSIGDQGLLNGLYDPFCSTIARVLVNAQVQGGKKIQDVFEKLKEKYNIDKREQFQIGQILLDMGYPCRSLLDGEDMIENRYA